MALQFNPVTGQFRNTAPSLVPTNANQPTTDAIRTTPPRARGLSFLGRGAPNTTVSAAYSASPLYNAMGTPGGTPVSQPTFSPYSGFGFSSPYAVVSPQGNAPPAAGTAPTATTAPVNLSSTINRLQALTPSLGGPGGHQGFNPYAGWIQQFSPQSLSDVGSLLGLAGMLANPDLSPTDYANIARDLAPGGGMYKGPVPNLIGLGG